MEKVIDSGYLEHEAEKHRRLSDAIRTVIEYVNPKTVPNIHINEVVDALRNEMETTEVEVLEYIFGKTRSRLVMEYKLEREKLPF